MTSHADFLSDFLNLQPNIISMGVRVSHPNIQMIARSGQLDIYWVLGRWPCRVKASKVQTPKGINTVVLIRRCVTNGPIRELIIYIHILTISIINKLQEVFTASQQHKVMRMFYKRFYFFLTSSQLLRIFASGNAFWYFP